ncbi:MAG: pyrrolysine--tRNA(Pyl) ligase large subunit [Clostridiales Family XIII bacterium]|jgi:phenylalanyl-tRNA synthetase alpha chain|nr:pyrrolysine--tRNA(Pyl) ligase large subunit [Clostridiales Family XIII bacterium]
MNTAFTTTQRERLLELGADDAAVDAVFAGVGDRDAAFRAAEKRLVAENRGKIAALLREKHMPETALVIRDLETWLTDVEGFTKVTTPTIISTESLDRMTLTEDEPLRDQIFYVGKNRCLRPMLAPNLYIVMRELGRITKSSVRIFETGSCFRRESRGARHLSEFTMLNCVEYGVAYDPDGADAERTRVDDSADGRTRSDGAGQMDRLEALAHAAMRAVGIEDFTLEREPSVVYGETIDIVADGVELASGSYGPCALDANWGVFAPWVGIGFGVERTAMVRGGHKTVSRVGGSLAFVDGVPLNI